MGNGPSSPTAVRGHHLSLEDSEPELPKTNLGRSISEIAMAFPMWLIPARVLVDLEAPLLPHSEMMKKNMLVQWQPGHKKKVVLISHQWASYRHPDPKMEQLHVLQRLLKNLASGRVAVGKDLVAESRCVDVAMPTPEEQRECLDWDVWYDFFGIPQIDDRGCVSTVPELQAAVDSIPAYCKAADFVVILAPSIRHADTGSLMSFGTWSQRGWCRAERTAAALSETAKPLLVVTNTRTIFASSGAEWVQSWPHDGEFTVEGDRETVKELTQLLLELKCSSVLKRGDLCRWRFYQALLNRLHPETGCPACHLAKCHTHGDFTNVHHQPVQVFLDRYRFKGYVDVGLTPLMMAAIEGCTTIIRELLALKAEVDQQTEIEIPDIQLSGKHTALTIAAALSTPQVVKCLLRANASPNTLCDTLGYTALNKAAVFGNYLVLKELAMANPELIHQPNLRGDTPIVGAVSTHNAKVTKVLLELRADPNQLGSYGHSVLALSSLHTSYMHHAEYLLKAGADPNLAGTPTRRWDSTLYKHWEVDIEESQTPQSFSSGSDCPGGETMLRFGTPLQMAADCGNTDLAKLLFEYGADVSLTSQTHNVQPIATARARRYHELAEFLAGVQFLVEL
mmetsp:Transcript_54702/g.127598  ORF Transcript_54702/g.127598 Transcript_54702/m.127598 type:complete len:622 (-) Transcript_54702:89-1954(-)